MRSLLIFSLATLQVLLLGLVAGTPSSAAQPSMAMPLNLEKGILHFYNLNYAEAIQWFQRETEENPSSARPHNHLAQAMLYRVLFRAGALESQLVSGNNPFLRRAGANVTPAEKSEFFHQLDTVMQLTAAAIAKDPKDADAMYSRGIAFGLRANYYFLVEKSWRAALSDATDARKLHNRVAELRPEFVDARLVQGAHDYVVGSLPLIYKMLGFLAGFRGDKEKGIRTLEDVARNGTRVPYDAKVLLAAIYRREGRQAWPRAIPILVELSRKFPANHLFRFELLQLYSDLGQEQEARSVIAGIDAALAQNEDAFPHMPRSRLDYAKGNFNFWYRDYPEALKNLRSATQGSAELDLHNGVLAYMRLGQVHDLMGNRAAARTAYEKAIALAPASEAAGEVRGYLRKPYARRDR